MSCECSNDIIEIFKDEVIADVTSTKKITLEFSQVWGIQINKSSDAVGNPKITIEATIDGTNWADYSVATTDVLIDGPVKFLQDTKFAFSKLRLKMDENGATGTITALLLLKSSM